MKGETVFKVSCLNPQSCKNNQPNCFFSRAIVQCTNASRDSHMTNYHLHHVDQHMLGITLIPYLCKLLVLPLRKGPKSEKVENVLS